MRDYLDRILFAPDTEDGAADANPGNSESPNPETVDTGLTVDGLDAGGDGEGAVAGDAKASDDGSLVDLSGGDAGTDGGEESKPSDGDSGEPPSLSFDEKPDWLPSNFYDEETGAVDVEALAKSQADLRKRMGEKGDVPETADGYKLEPENDDIAAIAEVALVEDDPVLSWFKNECLENGIPGATANRMFNNYLKTVGELMPAPVDHAAEMQLLGTKGPEIVSMIETKVKGMFNGGVLDIKERDAVAGWLKSATDVRAFHKIMQSYGEIGIPTNLPPTTGAMDRAQLQSEMAALMSDTTPGAQKRFEALQEKYRELYGDEPAGSSIVA